MKLSATVQIEVAQEEPRLGIAVAFVLAREGKLPSNRLAPGVRRARSGSLRSLKVKSVHQMWPVP